MQMMDHPNENYLTSCFSTSLLLLIKQTSFELIRVTHNINKKKYM